MEQKYPWMDYYMNRALQSDYSYDFPDKISKALKVEFEQMQIQHCQLRTANCFIFLLKFPSLTHQKTELDNFPLQIVEH